jgi:hypothetical protein
MEKYYPIFVKKEEIIPVDYTFAGNIDSSNILHRQITSNIPISLEICILYK